MQFLTLFAVGVLIGSAYADVECFRRRSAVCKENALSNAAAELELNFCDYQQKLFRCIADASHDCGMSFEKPALKVAETVESLCTKGSPLAREFNQHKKCLLDVASKSECYKPYVASLIHYDQEESQKEVCGQVDSVVECVAKDVARSCSRLTETFFRYLARPVVDMHKGYCDEVVFQH